ncbi:hypothetical protein Tco_1268725 [Tanacetum coccineum]
MDNPNITMEEYIRLEEEKARRCGKVYNWETATYATLSCEPTVSSLNDEIDFRISYDESDNEDFTPTVSCLDDLDYFNDFEKEFTAIVYNDAQTSKLDFLTEPTLSPQHINEFNLKNETSLFECDEEEQNVLNFNDLFPFNVIYPNDLKSDKDNDDDKVDIEHPSGDLSIKPLPDTDVGVYAHVACWETTQNVLSILIEYVFPDYLYGVSKPHGYDVFPSGRYPVFIFSTVYTTYSLNEYSVCRYQYGVSWGMDTVYRLPVLGHREGNINEYWWRIYKFGNIEVLES